MVSGLLGPKTASFKTLDINLQHQCEHAPYGRVFGQEIYSHVDAT